MATAGLCLRPGAFDCTWSIVWAIFDDALEEAERLAGVSDAEVVLYHRPGARHARSTRSPPVPPRLSEAIPFSYPGLDRTKLPTFLYLWQPDPTLPRTSPR